MSQVDHLNDDADYKLEMENLRRLDEIEEEKNQAIVRLGSLDAGHWGPIYTQNRLWGPIIQALYSRLQAVDESRYF